MKKNYGYDSFLFQKLKFVIYGPIDNMSALVHIIGWRRRGKMPSAEPMMA